MEFFYFFLSDVDEDGVENETKVYNTIVNDLKSDTSLSNVSQNVIKTKYEGIFSSSFGDGGGSDEEIVIKFKGNRTETDVNEVDDDENKRKAKKTDVVKKEEKSNGPSKSLVCWSSGSICHVCFSWYI